MTTPPQGYTHWQPAPQPPRQNQTLLVVAIVSLAALLVTGGVLAYLLLNRPEAASSPQEPPAQSQVPTPEASPTSGEPSPTTEPSPTLPPSDEAPEMPASDRPVVTGLQEHPTIVWTRPHVLADDMVGSSDPDHLAVVRRGTGKVTFVDLATGKTLWSVEPFDGAPVNWADGIDGSKVYAVTDGKLAVLDAATGELEMVHQVEGPPVLSVTTGGHWVLLEYTEGGDQLSLLDGKDPGRRLWTVKLPAIDGGDMGEYAFVERDGYLCYGYDPQSASANVACAAALDMETGESMPWVPKDAVEFYDLGDRLLTARIKGEAREYAMVTRDGRELWTQGGVGQMQVLDGEIYWVDPVDAFTLQRLDPETGSAMWGPLKIDKLERVDRLDGQLVTMSGDDKSVLSLVDSETGEVVSTEKFDAYATFFPGEGQLIATHPLDDDAGTRVTAIRMDGSGTAWSMELPEWQLPTQYGHHLVFSDADGQQMAGLG